MAESCGVDDIKQRTGVSDAQLNNRIKKDNLWELAGHLGKYELYIGTPGFGLTESDKADLDAIALRMAHRYAMVEAFKKWLDVPQTDVVTYQSLVEILIKLCRLSEAEAVCQFAKRNNISDEQNEECHVSVTQNFQFVNCNEISEREKEQLEIQLWEGTDQIMTLYARIEDSILSALNSHTDFEKMRNFVINSVQFFCNPERIEKLKKAKSIYVLSSELTFFKSFFNYQIIKNIVEMFGNNEEKELLAEYEFEFRTFCERSVFQVPSDIFQSSDSTNNECYAFKYSPNVDSAILLNDVVRLKYNLAKILNINPLYLNLKSIREGCICLNFLIPKKLAEKIFPLSETQRRALNAIHVQFVGDVNQTKSLKNTTTGISVDMLDDFHVTKQQVTEMVDQLVEKQIVFPVVQDTPSQQKAEKLPSARPTTFKVGELNFDTQNWEIEIARNFIKNKSLSSLTRQEAAQKLHQLASGFWNETIHKQLKSNDGIQLYEAQLEDKMSML